MNKKIILIFLALFLVINAALLISCGDVGEDLPVNGTEEKFSDTEPTDTIFILDPPPVDKPAIIHMIQPIDELDDWQSGKTEHRASLYVDDMTKVLDSLEWQNSDGDIEISGDFHFRINLYRPTDELDALLVFMNKPEQSDEEQTSETEDAEADRSEVSDISVQYLINYKDRVVNMRFSDYSAQTFDIYAQMDENDMKMLMLCLKYYFGPGQ